jgi:hypothetical protein
VHLDRAAESTCIRCGNYACHECFGARPDGLCAPCRLRTGPHPDDLGQVRLVAAFSIAHGVILLLVALMYLLVGGMFLAAPELRTPQGPDDPPVEMIFGLIAMLALVHLIPAILQIVAGIQLFRVRGRWLALIAFVSGVGTFMGCYCIPTSVALAIWGMVVLGNAQVRAAFEARQGK